METRALIIDDRGSLGPSLARMLEQEGLGSIYMGHTEATGIAIDSRRIRPFDLVFLDAIDLDRQQGDRTQSRLASLDILEGLGLIPNDARPRIVVYSTIMARPEVNIPLRQAGSFATFVTLDSLMANLDRIVRNSLGSTWQVKLPTVDDWANLHPALPRGARVADAHQRMREHARSWNQIWMPRAPFDKGAQMWTSRNVLPLLGLGSADGYRVAIEVIRKVAGLPYRLM